MRKIRSRTSSVTLLFAGVLFLPACSDTGNLIGPQDQLEVTNATDQFQFQLTALDQVTDSRTYDWQNTGTKATIDVSQEISGGSAILTVRDANGDVMYESDIADDSDGSTPDGVPGTWRIEIVLTNTTGTFNFRVQKAT